MRKSPTASDEARLGKAWKDGFKAGEGFKKRCPYKKETSEYSSWFEGWNAGAAKSLGFPYQPPEDGPGTLERAWRVCI